MADIQVPTIATVTPASGDTVLGVQAGAVKRFPAGPSFGQLAADAGASLVGFVHSGEGAIPRTTQARLREAFFSVCDYGAVGDGVTDDTLSIRAAITAAGVRGTVLFPSGKTFLISGAINPLEGQTLWGYGSALKRSAEVKAATSTAIGTGSSPTAITVVDGSFFSVGMDVTVYSGSSYDPQTHRVLSVVGNVVTVGTNFTVAFPSGGTLITAFPMISGAANRVSVLGLELDGNRSANTSLAKWEVHAAVRLASDYGLVEACYLHDEVCEGVYAGGAAISVVGNTIVNCGGNGIHFSGCAGAEASGNYIKNCNILGTAPGHADGLICFSNATEYTHVVNNYLDTGIGGVASIDSDDNSSVVITGNIIRSCTTTAIEGIFPSTTKGGKCVISNNLIYDSVQVSLNFTPSFAAGSGPYSWTFSGNYLSNTRLTLAKGFDLLVQGNIISLPSDTVNPCISVAECQRASILGNQITGGGNGLYISGANTYGLKISGNTILNNYQRGINFDGASSGRGNSIEGNTILVESTYTTNGTYIGMTLPNNWSVLNNVMDIQTTSTQACILCPNGAAGVNGAVVQGNVIRSSSITYDIRANGGSQNNFIVGNYTTKAVSNGGGASNTVAGNYIIN